LHCWLRGVRYATLTHDEMQRSVKCKHVNRRSGLKKMVWGVAVKGKQVKSQNLMILVKQKINCESTEKNFLTNVALFPDAVGFEKYNVQVCLFNFD